MYYRLIMQYKKRLRFNTEFLSHYVHKLHGKLKWYFGDGLKQREENGKVT